MILLAVFLCSHTFILFINVADVSELTSPIIILLNGANLRSPMKIKAKLCHTTFSSTFQKGRDYPAALKALLSQWEKILNFTLFAGYAQEKNRQYHLSLGQLTGCL